MIRFFRVNWIPLSKSVGYQKKWNLAVSSTHGLYLTLTYPWTRRFFFFNRLICSVKVLSLALNIFISWTNVCCTDALVSRFYCKSIKRLYTIQLDNYANVYLAQNQHADPINITNGLKLQILILFLDPVPANHI